MLIKIQGLPFKTKYQDVKLLVRSECTISDFKLDNLVVDSDGTKKVLVTVGNEAEAICLIKCLNGFRMSNCVLSVESIPTAKAADLDPTAPNTYDQRPATYTQPRTDYPNQGGIEYNRLPHNYGQSTQNMPQRPGEPMRGRNEGWTASNVGGNQWGHNSSANSQGTQGSGFPGTPIYPQHPSIPQRVDSGTYSGNRPQQSTNYGYPPKSNIPTVGSHQPRQDLRSVNLRSVDTSLNNGPPARYPSNYQQDKPITIMKDNFQGPTMYQMGVNSASYPGGGHGAPQVWNQGQEPKGQVYAKSNQPYEKYEDDRRHPQLDKRPDVKSSQEGVRVAVYKDYEKPRQFSPTRRNISGHENMKKRVPSPHVPSTREILARRLESPERKISPMGMAMSGRLSPPIRNMSPPIRRVSPSGRWTSATRPGSPPDRRGSPSSRRVAIRGMIISPSGRTVSSPGRLVSPSRRMSPMSGRAMAANMRVSPSGRRVSPAGRGQGSREGRTSPSGRMASPRMGGRHVSPTERRMSPGDRRILDRRVSPRRMAQKRSSPVRRLESPPPVSVRQETRYSPRHHIDKASDPKLDIDGLKGKQVRPAYEGQASSQAMYSGAYRPNLKENASYAMTGPRQPEQRMSPWRQDRDKNTYSSMKKQDDDRRDVNEKRHPRESHSPIHREHSPIRDHYRAGSPVSRSPRRSWALEKRPYCRSPESREIPPPPTWPGVKTRDEDTYKNKFNRPEDNPKDSLVWERPSMKIEESKRLHEPRVPEEKLRERGMPQRDMARAPYEPNPREPKFTPRHEFEGSRKEEYQRQRDMMRRSPDRREFRDTHPNAHERSPGPPERRHDEYRRPSPRREDGKKAGFHQEFDRDFEDIYKRAQEFRKKAEQMRRSNDRRRDGHSEEVHESHREDKYGRRDRSPHRRPGPERHEPDRHYDEPKYKDREPEWNLKKAPEKPKKTFMPPQVKAKRDKAIDELMGKIMRKYKQITDLPEDQRRRFADELRMALARLLVEMFGDKDVSFIEIVIKYDAKIGGKQEEMMVMDVLKCLPSLYRRGKRPAPEPESSSKMARYSPEAAMKEDRRSRWSPVKHKAQWEARPEAHRDELRPKYDKYEHPKEQRPNPHKPRPDARPMERRLPDSKPKFKPSESGLRMKMRPKQVEVRPKIMKPRVKVENKVSPRMKENHEASANAEPSKVVVTGPPSDETTNEIPPSGGYYELSPLMSRMLDTELQDIMIKVWQELPDNSSSEAEKLVINKLRNKAGDDLRNVFGLNVSQRLLNVFNVMYIKMKFTSNPEGQELTKFLVRNNITKFRWNNVQPLTYNAIVRTVKDFDRLCDIQVFTIGKVKVTITPLYQFTKCPLKLRTSYHIDNATSKNVVNDEGDKIKSEGTEEVKTTQPESNELKVAEAKPEEKVIEKPPVKVVPKIEVAKVVPTEPKKVMTTETKKVVPTEPKKVMTTETKKVAPTEPKKVMTTETKKVVPTEPKKVVPTETKKAVPAETKKVVPAETKKVVPAETKKAVPAEIKDQAKPVPTKIVQKPPVKKVEKKPVDKKEVKKEVKKPIDKKAKSACQNILQSGNDFDELNDDEIMALVSQGIILDQCSGSDED